MRSRSSSSGWSARAKGHEVGKIVLVEGVRVVKKPTVVGLPDGVHVEYFGVTHDGRTFVIFRPEEDWGYEDFVCLMGGDEVPLAPVKVAGVVRYRDGGTTDVKTATGDFHFPTCFSPEKRATFRGEPLTLYER
jgi:hypothetical protein